MERKMEGNKKKNGRKLEGKMEGNGKKNGRKLAAVVCRNRTVPDDYSTRVTSNGNTTEKRF
jgi:hypothetical protein